MLLKDFIEKLQYIEKESRGTHHFDGKVEVFFYLDDPTDEVDVEIDLHPEDPVEPWILMGCGCWAGANVLLQINRK